MRIWALPKSPPSTKGQQVSRLQVLIIDMNRPIVQDQVLVKSRVRKLGVQTTHRIEIVKTYFSQPIVEQVISVKEY
jgi:hypothetical protein